MARRLTVSGLICQPQTVCTLAHNRFVKTDDFTPRAVLRQNIKALMGTKDGPKTQASLAKASGVAQATIGRILKERGENARMETVDKLAKAFGLAGWQLLVAGLDPTNPPVLMPMTKEQKAFYERMQALYQDLGKYTR